VTPSGGCALRLHHSDSLLSTCRPEAVLRCHRRHCRHSTTTTQSPKRRAAPRARVLPGKAPRKSHVSCRLQVFAGDRLARGTASPADCSSLSRSRVRHPPLPAQTLREGIAKVTGDQQRDKHHTVDLEDYCLQRLNDPDWRTAHISNKVLLWMSLLVVLGLRWRTKPGDAGLTFYMLKRGTTVHCMCSAQSALWKLDSLLNAMGLESKEYHPNAAGLVSFTQLALVASNLVEVCGERFAEKLEAGDLGHYTAFEGGILSHPDSGDTWTYAPWGTTNLPLVTRMLTFAFPFADYGTLQRVSTPGAEGILICTSPLRSGAPPVKIESLVEQRRTNPTWAKLKEFAPEEARVLLVFLASAILGFCAKLKIGLMLLGGINTGKSTYTTLVKSGLGGQDGGFCCPCVHNAPTLAIALTRRAGKSDARPTTVTTFYTTCAWHGPSIAFRLCKSGRSGSPSPRSTRYSAARRTSSPSSRVSRAHRLQTAW